ncbi:MAG: XdhC family protein [Dehalococcoidia bacterium]|nr:MAG: XdhC family protein [Dehalococcoidia bacterium]
MHNDLYKEITKITEEGGEAALATVISASGSTPREEGAKMLVMPDGSIRGTIGGGSIELRVIKEAAEVIKKEKPKHLCYRLKEGEELGMICGGDVDVFIEPIISTPTLFILGGGHISFTLAKIGKLVGYKVVVVDDRPEFATTQRFPEAERVIAIDYDKAFSQLNVGKSGYIVIVTHGHKGDAAALEGALSTQAKYIGMIGSKTKNESVFTRLKAKRITQQQLDRVHAPVGLSIHAQTPEEIAISIMAQIIQVRRSY